MTKISLHWIVMLTWLAISATEAVVFSKSISSLDSSTGHSTLECQHICTPESDYRSVSAAAANDDKNFDEHLRELLRESMYNLGQEDVNIVYQTSDLLYKMGAPGIDYFLAGIKYYPKNIRYQAAKTLFATDTPMFQKYGLSLVEDSYPEVRFVLARNLFRFGDEDTRSFVWKLWRDSVPDITAACITYFGMTGGFYHARHILLSMDREDALHFTKLYPEVHNLATACHWALSSFMQDDPNCYKLQVIETPQDLQAIHFFWSIRLGQLTQPKEILAASESALSWPHWSNIQLARIRYSVAKASEYAMDGQKARQRYSEFLELHPDFGMNPEIACRLGELHDGVILHGTERDTQKAKYYYELTLALCDNINKTHPGVYYEGLKAHLGLAHLVDGLSNKKMHWEAIYHADPNKVAILPDTELTASKESYQDRLKWLRQRVEGIKNTAAEGLVKIYYLPDVNEGLKGLQALMAEYKHDELIMKLAQEEYQALLERQQ